MSRHFDCSLTALGIRTPSHFRLSYATLWSPLNLILIILDGHYCSSALRVAEAGSMFYTCHQSGFRWWTLHFCYMASIESIVNRLFCSRCDEQCFWCTILIILPSWCEWIGVSSVFRNVTSPFCMWGSPFQVRSRPSVLICDKNRKCSSESGVLDLCFIVESRKCRLMVYQGCLGLF